MTMASSALRTLTDASTEDFNKIIAASAQYSTSKSSEDLAIWESAIIDFINTNENLSISSSLDVRIDESIWLLEFMHNHLVRIQKCRKQEESKESKEMLALFSEESKKISALARPVKIKSDENEGEKKSDQNDYWSDLEKIIDAATSYYADKVPDTDKLTAWCRVIMRLAFIINYDKTHGIETLYGPKDAYLTQRIGYLSHKISQLNTVRNLLNRVKEIQKATANSGGYLGYFFCSVWPTQKAPKTPSVGASPIAQVFR